MSADRRIGFVDYQLDNFHANTYLQAIHGPLANRGYRVAAATSLDHAAGAAWCKQKGVPYAESVASLANAVDFLAVLAPSNPELHLGLCEDAFALGLPTFVDKTFAPDLGKARAIFELADTHAVPIQSTSALRTTIVQQRAAAGAPPQKVAVWSGGGSFEEYGIHPVELAVSCLGPEAESVFWCGEAAHPTIVVGFSGNRVATIDLNVGESVPFAAAITTGSGTWYETVDDSKLFVDAAAAILDFFDAGRALFDAEETLTVRRVLDAVDLSVRPRCPVPIA